MGPLARDRQLAALVYWVVPMGPLARDRQFAALDYWVGPMGPLARDRQSCCPSLLGSADGAAGPRPAIAPMQRLSTPLQWPISTVHLLSAPVQLPTGALQLPISSVQLPTGVGTYGNIRRKAVWPSGRMALWHGPSNGGSSIRSLASLHPLAEDCVQFVCQGGALRPTVGLAPGKGGRHIGTPPPDPPQV